MKEDDFQRYLLKNEDLLFEAIILRIINTISYYCRMW